MAQRSNPRWRAATSNGEQFWKMIRPYLHDTSRMFRRRRNYCETLYPVIRIAREPLPARVLGLAETANEKQSKPERSLKSRALRPLDPFTRVQLTGPFQFAGTWRTGAACDPGPGSGTGLGISAGLNRGTIWSAIASEYTAEAISTAPSLTSSS